ncbi:MAG: Mov34/MPN/PAD-1 family protein [Promethearchaeota archaeon]
MPLFKEVILTKNLQQKISDAAKSSYPIEACGVLFGHIDNEKTIVKEVVETENSADNPTTRFYIDPELFYKILTSAEEQGFEFLGIFHSHPARPNPSPWDLEYMKLHQNVWIIIQSFSKAKKPKMKAFQWYNDKLTEVQITII